jgi:hypothetical protein
LALGSFLLVLFFKEGNQQRVTISVLYLFLSYYGPKAMGRIRTGDPSVNNEVTLVYDTSFILNFFKKKG